MTQNQDDRVAKPSKVTKLTVVPSLAPKKAVGSKTMSKVSKISKTTNIPKYSTGVSKSINVRADAKNKTKFWRSSTFNNDVRAKQEQKAMQRAIEIQKQKTQTPVKPITYEPTFTKNAPVYYDEAMRTYTPDSTKTPVYYVINPRYPSDVRLVRGEEQYQKSLDMGYTASPLEFNANTEAYFNALYSSRTGAYVKSGSMSQYTPVKVLSAAETGSIPPDEVGNFIQEWEDKGYTVANYTSLSEEQKRVAENLTKQEYDNVVIFRKMLPETWYVMNKVGVSMADTNSWWSENPETGEEEMTLFTTHLSTSILPDIQNPMNTLFGIAADATSLRSPMLWSAQKSAGFGLINSVTIDPILAALKTIWTQNPYSTIYRGIKSKQWSGENGAWLSSNTTMWKNVGRNIREQVARIKASETNPDLFSDPQMTQFVLNQAGGMAAGGFDPEVRESTQALLDQSRISNADWQKQQLLDASTYREQAKIAMSLGNADVAVELTRKAVDIDRQLGKVAGDGTWFGNIYATASKGAYEDWTWDLMPEREEQFLRNVALVEIQKGAPLNVYEIVTLKNKYVDTFFNIAGDMTFDPTGPLLNLPGIVDGVPRLLGSGLKKVSDIPVTLPSKILKWDVPEAGSVTSLGKSLAPLLDTIQVPVSKTFIDKVNLSKSVKITSGAAEQLIDDSIKRMGIMSWLQEGLKTYSISSAAHHLAQNIYKTLRPVTESITANVRNAENLNFVSLIKRIAEGADSINHLDTLIQAGTIPELPNATKEAIVRLSKVGGLDPADWEEIAQKAVGNVYERTKNKVVSNLLRQINDKNSKNPIVLSINNKWNGLLVNKAAFIKWVNPHLKNIAAKYVLDNPKLAGISQEQILEEILKAGTDEVNKVFRDIFFKEEANSAASFEAFNKMQYNPNLISFEFGEVARVRWLNQKGITKIWSGEDITTDTLIGWLDRGKLTGESIMSKVNEETKVKEATFFRNALLGARTLWQGVNRFVYTSVLSGRPAFLITNFIDTNVRALIYGVDLTGSFSDVLNWHSHRGGLPIELLQSMSKDIITDPGSLAYRVSMGEMNVSNLPPLNWMNIYKYNANRVIVESGAARSAMTQAQSKNFRALIDVVRNPVRAFIQTNTEFNNLTEIVARTRTYHHFYLKNMDMTQKIFLESAMKNVSGKDKMLIESLINQAQDNPTKLRESIKRINGSVLYTQWIPPKVAAQLEQMEPSQALNLTGNVLNQLELIVTSNRDKTTKQLADLVSDFFDNTAKNYTETVDNMLREQSRMSEFGTDAITPPNVTDVLREIGVIGDKPIKRLPTQEMIDLQKRIEDAVIHADAGKKAKELYDEVSQITKITPETSPVITKKMSESLLAAGYTKRQIQRMTAEEAQKILNKSGTARTNWSVSPKKVHSLLNQMLEVMEENGADTKPLYKLSFSELKDAYIKWFKSIPVQRTSALTDEYITNVLKNSKWDITDILDGKKTPQEVLRKAIDGAKRRTARETAEATSSGAKIIDESDLDNDAYYVPDEFETEIARKKYNGSNSLLSDEYVAEEEKQRLAGIKLTNDKYMLDLNTKEGIQMSRKIEEYMRVLGQLQSNVRNFVTNTPGMIDWVKQSGELRSDMCDEFSAWYANMRRQIATLYSLLDQEVLDNSKVAPEFSLRQFLINCGFSFKFDDRGMLTEVTLKTPGYPVRRIHGRFVGADNQLLDEFRRSVFGSVDSKISDEEAMLRGFRSEQMNSVPYRKPSMTGDWSPEFTGADIEAFTSAVTKDTNRPINYVKLIKSVFEDKYKIKSPGIQRLTDSLKVVARENDSMKATKIAAAKDLNEIINILTEDGPKDLWDMVAEAANKISMETRPTRINSAARKIKDSLTKTLRQAGYGYDATRFSQKYLRAVGEVQASIQGITFNEWLVTHVGDITPSFSNLKPSLLMAEDGKTVFNIPVLSVFRRYLTQESYTGKELTKVLQGNDILNDIYQNTPYLKNKLSDIGDGSISLSDLFEFVEKKEHLSENWERYDTALNMKSGREVLGVTHFFTDGKALWEILSGSKVKVQSPANFVHELAHVVLPDISKTDFDIFANWAYGSKYVPMDRPVITHLQFKEFHSQILDGTISKANLDLYTSYQEAFAKGWTQHFITGNDLPTLLVTLYNKIKKAIGDFYVKYIRGTSNDVKLSPEMRDLYSRLSGSKVSSDYASPQGIKWNAIVTKNELEKYKLDVSTPEAFVEDIKNAISSSESDVIADVYRNLLAKVEQELNLVPDDSATTFDNIVRINSIPDADVKQGHADFIRMGQYNVQQLRQLVDVFKDWKDYAVGGLRNPDSAGEAAWFFKLPSDARLDKIRDIIDTVADDMTERNFKIINGGDYRGIKLEGAVNKTNDIMIDYTNRYRVEQPLRTVLPFWQFPSRSIPFWVKTLLSNTDVLNYYNKYLLTSYRQRVQSGAVNSSGEALKSLAGYIRVPGTDYWFNPTAPLSFRILFPSVYEEQSGYSIDDDETELSPVVSVIRSVIDTMRMRGVSITPTLSMILRGLDISDEPSQSIIPQADLIPKWTQRYITSKIRRLVPAIGEQWSPDVDYKDALIEQAMLRDFYSQGQRIKQNSSDRDVTAELYDLYLIPALVMMKSPEERKLDPTWIKYQKSYEQTEWAKSVVGFMTSVYPKRYTDADAQWTQLRNEMNLLRDAMVNDVGRELFTTSDSPISASEAYKEARYNSPEGTLYTLKQLSSWITDEAGRELQGNERIEKIADKITQEQLISSYYDASALIYKERNDRLAQLPPGTPYSIKEPIYEEAVNKINALNDEPVFATIKSLINQDFGVNSKSPDKLYMEFERRWWEIISSAEPNYEDYESYTEWETARQEWLNDLPDVAKTQSVAFQKEIQDQVVALFPGISLPAGYFVSSVPSGTSTIIDAESMNKVSTMLNDLTAMMVKITTPEGYENYKKSNDTAIDALGEAWTETYSKIYYQSVEGKKNEERELAERKFRQTYPTPPTDEELIEWVLKNYPKGQFTRDELLSATGAFVGETLDIDESMALDRTEKEQVRENIYTILNMIGPGTLYTSFLNNLKDPNIGGGTDTELNNFYDSFANMSMEELDSLYESITRTASYMGISEPSDNELVVRGIARQQNEDLTTFIKSQLGENWYNTVDWYYGLGYAAREAALKQYPFLESGLEKYKKIKENWASTHPTWARFFGQASSSSSSSGGGSGGSSSGKRKSSKTKEKEYAPLVGTPWKYEVPYNMVRMGYRSTLDASKLIDGYMLGRGGAGGVPKWPDEMIRKLEFSVWIESWPSDLKNAMGSQLITDLQNKYIYGTALTNAAISYIDNLALSHPEWKSTLENIVNQQ